LTRPIKNPDIPQKPSNTGLCFSFGCYGCETQDHGMSNCPTLSELVTQEIIKCGMDNRYIMKDNSKIFRDLRKIFVQVAKRLHCQVFVILLLVFMLNNIAYVILTS